jgi:hypothetical protein
MEPTLNQTLQTFFNDITNRDNSAEKKKNPKEFFEGLENLIWRGTSEKESVKETLETISYFINQSLKTENNDWRDRLDAPNLAKNVRDCLDVLNGKKLPASVVNELENSSLNHKTINQEQAENLLKEKDPGAWLLRLEKNEYLISQKGNDGNIFNKPVSSILKEINDDDFRKGQTIEEILRNKLGSDKAFIRKESYSETETKGSIWEPRKLPEKQ